MRDIQNENDTRKVALQKVGVKGLHYPITVLDKKMESKSVGYNLEENENEKFQYEESEQEEIEYEEFEDTKSEDEGNLWS